MAAIIGALRGVLSLDSAAFERGAKRAQASMSGLQRKLHASSVAMQRIGRRMTLGITAPLAGMATIAVKSSLSTIDAQAKLAQSLGTTTESIQTLTRAGDLAGVSMGEIEQATIQMTKRLSEAAAGGGPAADALARLNLNAKDLLTIPLDQRIAKISDAIKEFIPEAEQAAVQSEIFGARAGLVFSRIDSSVLRQASDEIRRFGVAVSDVDADQIEAANDAMSALGLVTRGLGNQLAVALAPALESIAKSIAELAGWFSHLSPEMKTFIASAAAVAAALGPIAIGLGLALSAMSSLVPVLGLMRVALLALVGPWGLVAAAGVAAAAYIYTNWTSIKDRFPGIVKAISGAVDGLKALFSGDLKTAMLEFKKIPEGLAEAWQSALDAVEAELGPWPAWLLAQATTAVRFFVNPFARLPQDIVQVFVDAWQGIVAEVTQWAERFRELGGQVIDGFLGGIKSRDQQVNRAGRNLGRQITQGAESELEVQSPSRVFERIGAFTVEGFIRGLTGGKDQVQEAIRDVVDVGAISAELPQASGELANSLAQAFGSIVTGADQAKEAVRQLLQQLANRLLQRAFLSVFGGPLGAIENALFPNAKGNAFLGGRPLAFASGGVISSPTLFPMAGGRTGLMGESGPEAIVPLARTRGGDLGIRMEGGRQAVAVEVSVADDGRLVAIAREAGAVGGAGVVAARQKTFAQDVQTVMRNTGLRGR